MNADDATRIKVHVIATSSRTVNLCSCQCFGACFCDRAYDVCTVLQDDRLSESLCCGAMQVWQVQTKKVHILRE